MLKLISLLILSLHSDAACVAGGNTEIVQVMKTIQPGRQTLVIVARFHYTERIVENFIIIKLIIIILYIIIL
jgi:hypothetical protein